MKCASRPSFRWLARALGVIGALQALATLPSAAQTPEPLDQPYPGTLILRVDLTDSARKIFRVHETIPARPGPFSLHYPKWIPGEHGPSGTIDGVTGIKFTAGGQRIPWTRDLLDMFTLHLDVPAAATAIEMEFQFLSPTSGGEFGQSVSATNKLVDLEWNQVAFYPAGYWARQVSIQPGVTLPAGWSFGTALEIASQADGVVQFKALSFENLVDSPLIAGKNFQRLDLAPGLQPAVHLDLAADRPENLALTPEQLKAHVALVTQASALFGAHHYGHYDFLFTLSDNTGHFGLEHHQSSDDRLEADFFTDPDVYLTGADLLPHEYVHSWNGKFRRPADLWTPNFNVPMQDDLLWVYEGLTEYLGKILTARSGLRNPAQYRDALAVTANTMGHATGRAWRPLQDTADEAQILYYVPEAWVNWRRSVDFYDEGELLWLDADTTLRELSHGARSLDDFVRAFYGINDGSYVPVTYTFADIVAALNQVQPYDWAAFLRTRLDSTAGPAPLDGLKRGGWKLVYTDQPTDYFKAREKVRKNTNLLDSLGVAVDAGDSAGTLLDVLWGSPAFEAGLAPDMKLIAVNGDKFSGDLLKDAIKTAQGGTQPIELLVQNLDSFITVKVDYHDGLKYPRLERIEGTPDRLADIIKARP